MEVTEGSEDGVATFVKRAYGAAEESGLAHEYHWLRRAAHPGVVRLLSGPSPLVTRSAGPSNLSAAGPIDPDDVARLGAAIATTLADLHDLGVAHHAVAAEHIVVDERGAPILCGFSRAAPLDDAGADDVAALGRLLAALVGSDGGPRLGRILRSCESSKPPSARALASSLAKAVQQQQPGPAAPRDWRPRRRPVLLGGLLAAVLVLAASGWLITDSGHRSAAVAGPTPTTTLRPAPAPLEIGPGGPPACPPADERCRPVPLRRGTFSAGGHRWHLSEEPSVVVLGRWRCSGALPAVLDRATGQVWEFSSWPAGGRVRARAVARIPRARSLRVVPGAGGCDHLRVLRADGPDAVVTSGRQE